MGVDELVLSAPGGGLDATIDGGRRHLTSLSAGEGDIADRAKEMRANFEALANEITCKAPPLEQRRCWIWLRGSSLPSHRSTPLATME